MRCRSRTLPLLAFCVVTAASLAAGCSTLDVQEAYVDESKSPEVTVAEAGARVTASFVPDLKFSSYGAPGVPAVPVQVKPGATRELRLRVTLALTAQQDFSLADSVCVTPVSGADLCSGRLTLQAGASRGDPRSPAGWQKVFGMYANSRIDIAKSAYTQERGIDRALVYQTYGYGGAPPWERLSVTLVYTIACAGACPAEFRLDGTRLVLVGHAPLSLGTPQFHRAKLTSYRFAVDPGP